MIPSASIHCPTCGYDLGAALNGTGECPECGSSFDRAEVVVRTAKMRSFSLLLIGVGVLGVLIGSSLGRSFQYMARADQGSGGDGESAAQVLERVPLFVMAYGVCILALATARTPLQRRWPLAIAGIFTLIMIARFSGYWGAWDDFSKWIQPEIWIRAARWSYGVAEGLLAVAAVIVLRRISREAAPRLLLFIRLLLVASIAATIFAAASMIHSEYLNVLAQGNLPWGTSRSPFGGSNPRVPYVASHALNGTLSYLSMITWWLTWPAVGLLALHLRVLTPKNAPLAQ